MLHHFAESSHASNMPVLRRLPSGVNFKHFLPALSQPGRPLTCRRGTYQRNRRETSIGPVPSRGLAAPLRFVLGASLVSITCHACYID